MKIDPHDRIYVAGGYGLAGSAIIRALHRHGARNILTTGSDALDHRDRAATKDYFVNTQPKHVFVASALVGGIKANSDRLHDFLMDNLEIQNSLFRAALHVHASLTFLSSTCAYPCDIQILDETDMWMGAPHASNSGYAVAKRAGMEAVSTAAKQYGLDWKTIVPCNLYGPGDLFDETHSHVLPALIMKFARARNSGAKTVELWGDGTPLREFMHSEDMAEAAILVHEHGDPGHHYNAGANHDITIASLAESVAQATGYTGSITWNGQMGGTQRKKTVTQRLRGIGWKGPRISLKDGLQDAVDWYMFSEKHGESHRNRSLRYRADLLSWDGVHIGES